MKASRVEIAYIFFKRNISMTLLSGIVLILYSIQLSATEPLKLDVKNFKGQLVGSNFEYLEDKDGKWKINDVVSKELSSRFKASGKDTLNFGNTKSTYWLRVNVLNPESVDLKWFLELEFVKIDQIRLYIPNHNGGFIEKKGGDFLPFHERDIEHRTFVFPITSKPGESFCYLAVASDGMMRFPLQVWSEKNLHDYITTDTIAWGFFFGILIVMLIYNIFIFLSVRDMSYLNLSLVILSATAMYLASDGTGFQFIWPDTPWMTNLNSFFTPLVFAFLYLFVRSFLEVPKYMPKIDKIYIAVIGLSMALSLSYPFLSYLNYQKVFMKYLYQFPVINIMSIVIAVIVLRKGNRAGKFYIIASTFFAVMGSFYIFAFLGIMPDNFITNWGDKIGLVTFLTFLSLGLADKINTLTTELQMLNVNLEAKVGERTSDLSDVNKEISTAVKDLEDVNFTLEEANKFLGEKHVEAETDLQMAIHVQKSLYPEEIPLTDDWDIALMFKPKAGISGDMYDFYIDEDKLKGVILIDVSGHGLASGLITMIVRSIFSRCFSQMKNEKLNSMVERVNREMLIEARNIDNYLSGLVLRFNEDNIEYVNAGYTDILLKSPKRDGVLLVRPKEQDFKGNILAVEPMIDNYKVLNFKMIKGEVMMLYSDCFIQSINKANDEYGIERLSETMYRAPDGSAEEILNFVIDDFREFVEEEDLDDDLTVIVMKRIN